MPTFKNFIAGAWVEPSTGAYFENRNPADWNDLIGRFPRSGPEDVRRAIASAQRGFAAWSRTPAPVRGQVLQRVGDLLVRNKEPLARELQSFLESVEQGREPVVPGEHGVRAMKAAETILKEMRAHRWK